MATQYTQAMEISPSPPQPTILLISLDKQPFWDEMYSRLVDAMSSKATIRRASRRNNAMDQLSSSPPSAIIITDPSIAKQARNTLTEKIVVYVRGGGTAILATHFSGFARPLDVKDWFRTSWDLPWEFGDYHRTTVHLNPHALAQTQVPAISKVCLAQSYSQKAVFLANVQAESALYLPSAASGTQSMVFAASAVDTEQTPVVFAKIGDGWLGYVGDVNMEAESTAVILAMCGLS